MAGFDSDFSVAEQPKRGFSIYNILTVLVLILSVLTAAVFALAFAMPGLMPPAFQPQTPTAAATAFPLDEINIAATWVAKTGVPPTWTPSATAPPSSTPTPRSTSTATPTPSMTPTWQPTYTPSVTPTPTASPTLTPSPGPSPTPEATHSAYPFTFDNPSPSYTYNFANTAGCGWLGVAGQVSLLDGSYAVDNQFMIQVWDSGVNAQTFTGHAPAYGPSGWEVYINDQPRIGTHRIQLFTPNGTPVSEVYEFSTRASCAMNLTLINFVQNH